MKTVGEILGKRESYLVRPDMSVKDVVDYLVERGIGAVAVCEGPMVVGVFSERDLMRRVVHAGLDPNSTLISEVMTPDVFHVPMDEKRNVAQALMLGKNFRHLAVVDEDERFKGFVSMRELLEVDIAEARNLIGRLNDDYYQQQFDPKRDR